MRRPTPFSIVLGLVLSFSGGAVVMAHEGEAGEATIAVEPSSVTAGGTVVLAGSGLEPEAERVLVLAGQDLVVEFGTVRTDAEGTFRKELTIPGHLPAGAYELRAIGDETLTVPLSVTAAGSAASPPATVEETAIVPRERTPVELGAILVLAALAAIAGALLVWRAERFRGTAGA